MRLKVTLLVFPPIAEVRFEVQYKDKDQEGGSVKNQQHENDNKVGQNVLQEEPSTFVWKSSGGTPSEKEWEGEHHCGSPKEDSEFF